MPTPIPFIVYGDGPRLHSGLARIARDLTARLVAEEEDLGIKVMQLGVDDPGGWHWQGWDFFGFQPHQGDQGRHALRQICAEIQAGGGQQPIVLTIMDPSRCYDLIRPPLKAEGDEPPWCQTWGYYPIDGENPQGAVGGPASYTITHADRILAYGQYGAGVLKQTLRQGEMGETPVPYLPHGMEPGVFVPGVSLAEADDHFQAWRRLQLPGTVIIGAVATNQPRKDLGLLFESVVAYRSAVTHPVALWLHTDYLTKHWDVGELARVYGFEPVTVLASTAEITDRQLAARYCASTVTIAPGLGEGFGYPIVESLSCGTPVVHGDYAGGPELMPQKTALVPVEAWRTESCYVVLRPVFDAIAVAKVIRSITLAPKIDAAYLHHSMTYLGWDQMWPRWRQWITQGLTAYRGRVAPVDQGEG